jgi:nucleoid-associated protein YgaU
VQPGERAVVLRLLEGAVQPQLERGGSGGQALGGQALGGRAADGQVAGEPRAGREPKARPARPPERYAPIRLTRRGRIVARALLILAALITLVSVAAGTRAAANAPAPRGEYPSVVVQPGDTLWNIASRHAPGVDRRATMNEIRRLNHLRGSTVEVGQKLLLPRR